MRDVVPLTKTWVITKYENQEAYDSGVAFDVVRIDGNTLLSEGITEVLKLLTGLTATNFGSANAYIGVGDSIDSTAASQLGLQASTNKFYKAVDSGYPIISGSDVTWRATFAGNEANFAWNEFTIANGSSDTAANLNRKVSSQGTKVSNQLWTVNLTITFADAGTGTGGGGGGGTPATGVIGYLGASLTMGAVEGAITLGSLRFWNPVPTYGGGGIYEWTSTISTSQQSTTSADMAKFLIVGDPESPGGATWTYTSTDAGVSYNLKGVYMKPAGAGPFPGIIVSHGAGSTAPVGGCDAFRDAGFVAIGTNYTHSSDNAGLLPSGGDGASTANLQRAHKCWDILKGLGFVDMARVAAQGHSMGAFVTAALVGTYPYDFKAAAHTAGGEGVNGVWTSAAQAGGIRVPYNIQHGTADATVPIQDDRDLKAILDANGVTNQMIEYSGESHSDMLQPAKTTVAVDWFTTHGLFTAVTNSYWTKFNNALVAQPTNTFWLQLCAIATDAAQETYANVVAWINEVKRRVPGAIIYISAQPKYVPASTCSIAGSNGPDRMEVLVNQIVSNGVALAGPVIGPWDYTTDLDPDLCHPNATGKAIAGQQIMDFFYSIPGGVPSGGGGGGTPNYNTRPVGIYSLDTVVNKSFVSGVLKRVGWSSLESSQGQYNFSTIGTIINSAVAANQKVSLVVFADRCPTYVNNAASATMNTQVGIAPVPWDTFAQTRWAAMMTALGNYVVGGYALKDHPALAQVDCSIIGSQGIRLATLPAGYSDALYKAACIQAVDTVATVFPKKNIYVGLFGIGGPPGDAITRDIRDTLLATYNGLTLPRINFFVETFTGYAPDQNSGTGLYLYEVRNSTSIMGQACWQYTDRSQGTHCTWESVPNIQNMFDKLALYNGTYLEVYVEDLNNVSYQTILTNEAAAIQARYNTLIS